MSTPSAPRADTFGATSGAATSGTSAPGFEVLNSPNGPNSFLFQRSYGCPRRLESFDGLSSGSHRIPRCYLCQSLLRLQTQACGPWLLEMSFGSRCHTPPCRSARTFSVGSPMLSIFAPPCSTYRCPFTEPFDGFRSTMDQSSRLTIDSPALGSTVISRYRPGSPSVATSLLSMDMLPIVTAFRSTSSGHHSPLELSLGRSSPSLEMSYCGALIGRRWYTPSVHSEGTFHIGYRLRCVSCPGIHLLHSAEVFLLPIQEWVLSVSVIFIARFPKRCLFLVVKLESKCAQRFRSCHAEPFQHALRPDGSGRRAARLNLRRQRCDSASVLIVCSAHKIPTGWTPAWSTLSSLFIPTSRVIA